MYVQHLFEKAGCTLKQEFDEFSIRVKLDLTVEGESGLNDADEVSNFISPPPGRRLQVSGDGTDTFS